MPVVHASNVRERETEVWRLLRIHGRSMSFKGVSQGNAIRFFARSRTMLDRLLS